MKGMGMGTRVVVLGASRYKFAQEGSGELIEGSKVHYVEQNFDSQTDSIGAIPQTASLDYEYFGELAEVPGVYDADFAVSLRGKKPQLKVSGFKFVAPFSFRTGQADTPGAAK